MEKLSIKIFTALFCIFIFLLTCFQRKDNNTKTITSFQDNGNGTIKDLRTGFIWQKCGMGQVYTANTCAGKLELTNWLIAMRYCEKLTLANLHWRLPTSKEFADIISPDVYNQPSETAFPNNGKMNYWSSTSHETVNLVGIVINTQVAKPEYKVKFVSNAVRCIMTHRDKKKINHHEHIQESE